MTNSDDLLAARRAVARALDDCACAGASEAAAPEALEALGDAVAHYAECARRSGAVPEALLAELTAVLRADAAAGASAVDLRRRWERAALWAVHAEGRRHGGPDLRAEGQSTHRVTES